MNMFTKPPGNLGVVDGRLAACPGKPNCVCTQAESGTHAIAPISFDGTAAAALQRLKAVVIAMALARIVEEGEDYLRVEFTTAVMRYVDDVEFLIDTSANEIHFRSASRIGYSDLGANRKRMESVRAAFEAGS